MSVAQRNPDKLARVSTLKLPRKQSARDLKDSSRSQLNGPLYVVPPVPTLITVAPRTDCPRQGLTIDTGTPPRKMEPVQPFTSGPASKTIRRLPSLPVALPSTSTVCHSSENSSTGLTRHASLAPSAPRAKRPLPAPPAPPPVEKPSIPVINTNVAPSSSLPTSRRKSKPLPTPVQRTQPPELPPSVPTTKELRTILEIDRTPPPTPPKTMAQYTPSPSQAPTEKAMLHVPPPPPPVPKSAKSLLGQALRRKDAPTAVMLHTHLVLERNMRMSRLDVLTDDDTSEESLLYSEPVFRETSVGATAAPGMRRSNAAASAKDSKLASEMANRIMYQQVPSDGHPTLTSKWVREVKGKRYTEQDFENVMKALRTL